MTRFILLIALAFTVAACDSSEPEPEPEPTLAQFRIASVVVPGQAGTELLLFTARPTETIELTLVNIENPRGQSIEYITNNQVVAANQPIDLQDDGTGYTRVSGEWTFRFTYISEGGAGQQRIVTETLSVSALTPDGDTPVE